MFNSHPIKDRIARRLFPANRIGRMASNALFRLGLDKASRYSSRFSKYVPPTVNVGEFENGGAVSPLLMLGLNGDDHIARFAWLHRPEQFECPLPSILRRLCRDLRCVTIIGANTGFYVLQVASTSNAERIIAFEPYDRARSILEANLALNMLSARVNVVAMAVGALCEEAEFILPVPRFGTTVETSGTLEKGFHSEKIVGTTMKVRVTTLDAWRSTMNVPIDLVHLDVEGHEHAVLLGASNTVAGDRPHIFIEVLANRASDTRKLTEFCHEHNYSCFQLSGREIREFERVTASELSPNQWLIPRERVAQTEIAFRGSELVFHRLTGA